MPVWWRRPWERWPRRAAARGGRAPLGLYVGTWRRVCLWGLLGAVERGRYVMLAGAAMTVDETAEELARQDIGHYLSLITEAERPRRLTAAKLVDILGAYGWERPRRAGVTVAVKERPNGSAYIGLGSDAEDGDLVMAIHDEPDYEAEDGEAGWVAMHVQPTVSGLASTKMRLGWSRGRWS